MLKIAFSEVEKTLLGGVSEISGILGIEISAGGVPVAAVHNDQGLYVAFKDGKGTIGYSGKVEFYRGLGLFVENYSAGKNFEIRESAKFESLGALFDNSRNGVLKVGTIKKMITHMALMGFNQLLLYMEDTYEVPQYPYFGYMRGRFSAEEIRECDRFAKMFGIALIPSIQTLAHLNGAFRWNDFKEFNDCDDIMLIGDEKAYEFIDAAIASLSKMFTSREINIGMDEAHMVGLGKYLERNGYHERFELMMGHLKKVIGICHKYGFKPTMWSDMFFNLLSLNYYDDADIDNSVLEKVPSDVALAYWDYYSTKKETYDKNLEKHQKFHNKIVFAGGGWKWMGMVPANRFSLMTGRLALQSCVEHNIKKVMVTGWGDNGAECSSFATLPALQLFAEFCYSDDNSDSSIAKRLKTCANANLEDFMNLDLPNLLPGNEAPGGCSINPSKYLLYQDLLCGLFDSQTEVGKYNDFYASSAGVALKAKSSNPKWAYLFETNACLSAALEIKCDIGLKIKHAYESKDIKTLRELSENELSELLARVEKLHEALRTQWLNENKVFGLDVQDIRLGALKERIRAAQIRINDYLSGKADCLEELEQERLDYMCRKGDKINPHITENLWGDIVTPNVL
jgi:hexosaminidase